MAEQRIDPSKVTKPIQLLAAWLAGLVLTDSAFLTAASVISKPEWAAGALVIASIANVPVFLAALFLLQTRFRPEMQEDVFYAKYLEQRYSTLTRRTETVAVQALPMAQTPMSLQMTAEEPSSGISIEVNDLLPRFTDLVKALAKEGIHPSKTFGSTNEEPKVPERFVIAVGNGVPVSLVQRVVRAAMPYGLDGIQMAGAQENHDMHNKRLYLGSYNLDGRNSVELAPEIVEQIMFPSLTEKGLRELLASI